MNSPLSLAFLDRQFVEKENQILLGTLGTAMGGMVLVLPTCAGCNQFSSLPPAELEFLVLNPGDQQSWEAGHSTGNFQLKSTQVGVVAFTPPFPRPLLP